MNQQSPKGRGMKKILIGVGGGIAVYKAVEIVRVLKQAGHDVQVVMTPAACQFVTPLTFSALLQKTVRTELFPSHPTSDKGQLYPHLYPATEADLFIVLPATADLIGKFACGLGDDIVSASALSLPAICHKFFCPAMNPQMWANHIVQKNVQRLETFGWERIGPEEGLMACGTTGIGRMSESDTILSVILEH